MNQVGTRDTRSIIISVQDIQKYLAAATKNNSVVVYDRAAISLQRGISSNTLSCYISSSTHIVGQLQYDYRHRLLLELVIHFLAILYYYIPLQTDEISFLLLYRTPLSFEDSNSCITHLYSPLVTVIYTLLHLS